MCAFIVMELLRITRQIHCKAVEQRATLIHRQYNRGWGTSYSRPPIDPYLTSLPVTKSWRRHCVIGTTSGTAGHKLVKNLKYNTKMALAVGALDQFLMKFSGAVSVLGTVEDIRSIKIRRFLTRCMLANVVSPV